MSGCFVLEVSWKRVGVRKKEKKKWDDFNLWWGCQWVTPAGLDVGSLSMWQGQVLLPGTPEYIYECSAVQMKQLIKILCSDPCFCSNAAFYQTVTGERIDWPLSFILSRSSFWSQRSEPRWYTTLTVIIFNISNASKAIPEEAQCHTRNSSSSWPSSLVANTTMAYFILRQKSFLDRWRHQRSSSLVWPLLPPSIMLPVCPVLIGSFQFINHFKKSPSSTILWGLANRVQSDLNLLVREDMQYVIFL